MILILNKLNFLDFARVRQGVLSCALDSFLEVRLIKALPSFFQTASSSSSILTLLVNSAVQYQNFQHQFQRNSSYSNLSQVLHILKPNIRGYITSKCPLFLTMDCNS